MSEALGELRTLARVEAVACVSPVRTTTGWAVDRFHADNVPNAARFRMLLASYLTRAGDAYGWFDPHRPEADQRNVFVDLRDRISADELATSPGVLEVLQPVRLHEHHVVRALVCEGESLIAWLGVFHPTALTAHQRGQLERALPALRKQLIVERQVQAAPLIAAALDAVLEHIAAPAFIIASGGRIFDVNAAGRAILATRPAEVSASLAAAVAHEKTALPVELTPLDAGAAPDHWLAIVRAPDADSRIAHAIARVSARLKLTPRQRDVLSRVVTGDTNAAIAAMLSISERAVEQHISALFERSSVTSRAALVTSVLLGSDPTCSCGS
ncbi:MAG: helix-turn-helix transcriptional regulator [Deltaproteobacteria bacterium]|nr:helix-turn-helix transcriptional regulator [Deltaproteobacteria bacterium]